jgi:integrase
MRQPTPFFRKQTQTWYVQIGKKQINLGKDKKEATKRYHQLMAEHKRYTGDDTVFAIIEAYKGWLRAEKAKSTATMRSAVLLSFQEHIGTRLKAWQVKPHHVQSWCTEKYGHRSSTWRNYVTNAVGFVFSWAKKQGYISENPLKGMEKPKAEIRQEFLPADVWPKLLALPKDEAFRDWLHFMLLAGARTQEMFKIEARYFDKAGARIVFPIIESKGKKRSRVIYLPTEAVEIAGKWAARFPDGPMFRNTDGKPWNKNSINCRFKRLKVAMREPKLCATVLRHSFAHHRLASGQDSLLVSKLLGHTSGHMLATRYGHVEQNPDLMLRAANAVSTPNIGS